MWIVIVLWVIILVALSSCVYSLWSTRQNNKVTVWYLEQTTLWSTDPELAVHREDNKPDYVRRFDSKQEKRKK